MGGARALADERPPHRYETRTDCRGTAQNRAMNPQLPSVGRNVRYPSRSTAHARRRWAAATRKARIDDAPASAQHLSVGAGGRPAPRDDSDTSPKEPVAPIWPFSLVHFLLLSVSASFELQTNTDRLEFRTRLQGSGLSLCKVVVRRAGSQTELAPLPSAPKRWAENTREPSGTAGRLATRSLAPAPGRGSSAGR